MSRDFYFKNKRLQMGGGGRFLVRLFSYAWYGALASSVPVLLFADLKWMHSLGFFISIFLIDRLIHLNHAEEKLSDMPAEGRINLDLYLSPSALNILERASEKTAVFGGETRSWLLKQCLTYPEVRSYLSAKGMNWKEIDKSLTEELKTNREKTTFTDRLVVIESMVKEAYQRASVDGSKFIKPRHLFYN